jgi:hypothetical protein
MNDLEHKAKPRAKATLIYGKLFALLGLICGAAMVFGTPGVVLLFHQGLDSQSREWVESLPDWTAPTMLCIGMGGGAVTVVLSALFGLLIPSRVVREGSGSTGD